MSHVFTVEQDHIILDGRAGGLAWNAIGKRIGTTGKACQYRLTRGLGAPDPKVVQVGRSKLRSDYDDQADAEKKRPAMPAGDDASWQAVTAGTVLDGSFSVKASVTPGSGLTPHSCGRIRER